VNVIFKTLLFVCCLVYELTQTASWFVSMVNVLSSQQQQTLIHIHLFTPNLSGAKNSFIWYRTVLVKMSF